MGGATGGKRQVCITMSMTTGRWMRVRRPIRSFYGTKPIGKISMILARAISMGGRTATVFTERTQLIDMSGNRGGCLGAKGEPPEAGDYKPGRNFRSCVFCLTRTFRSIHPPRVSQLFLYFQCLGFAANDT